MQMQIVCNWLVYALIVSSCKNHLRMRRNWTRSLKNTNDWESLNGIVSMAGAKHAQRDYEGELREAGIRITQPRKVILEILSRMEDHPDAMEIFRRAVKIDATISLATVYRTMKLLEELGAVHRHSFEGGPARFENADGEHHDHLIDLDTGDVIEFHSERIEQLQQQIADELGYDIEHHRLELYGRKRK